MELNIGSNIIRNTSGVLSVQGQNQISIEIREKDSQVLLTMDIYDGTGNHIAKLKRNTWVFNSQDKFEVTPNPQFLTLTDRITGEIVIKLTVTEQDKIQVLQGKFFTYRGNLLEITPQYWRIAGGITMSEWLFDGRGGGVAI